MELRFALRTHLPFILRLENQFYGTTLGQAQVLQTCRFVIVALRHDDEAEGTRTSPLYASLTARGKLSEPFVFRGSAPEEVCINASSLLRLCTNLTCLLAWTLHNYASETTWPLREGEGAIEKDKSFPNVCDVGGRLRVRLLVPWQEHFR